MMKEVCGNWYVHTSNTVELYRKIMNKKGKIELMRVQQVLSMLKQKIPIGNIVKYNSLNRDVTLLYSGDWDSSNEPEIHESYIHKADTGEIKYVKGKGQIYHNKWQFVSETYRGFDISEAKQRTQLWNSIPDIKLHKSKIGYKKYWVQLLKENGIPL